MRDNQIHIGQIIQKTLQEKGISASWLASKINCHTTNMYKIFQKKYIDPQLMEAISIALDIDLFASYSNYVNGRREQNRN